MVEFQFLDKRVQRTKKDLYHALFELLKEKKYEQITIKEIIDFAGYSRGTFYVHYREKDDLLNEIIYYLFKEAQAAQRTSYINEDSIDVQELENEPIYILRHFEQYGEYYKILLSNHLQIDFQRQLIEMFVNIYLEDFEMTDDPQHDVNKELLNKSYAYGLIGMILDWITNDFPIPAEEFSTELVKIFKYSLKDIHIKKR
ncbi:TetR/AcrR family transcriptional regulator [Oceanobacillus sp. CAU 1775]